MPISIKPSHKGKLHQALGVKLSEKIPLSELMQAKKSKSPALRKQATFALNAKSWRH